MSLKNILASHEKVDCLVVLYSIMRFFFDQPERLYGTEERFFGTPDIFFFNYNFSPRLSILFFLFLFFFSCQIFSVEFPFLIWPYIDLHVVTTLISPLCLLHFPPQVFYLSGAGPAGGVGCVDCCLHLAFDRLSPLHLPGYNGKAWC